MICGYECSIGKREWLETCLEKRLKKYQITGLKLKDPKLKPKDDNMSN